MTVIDHLPVHHLGSLDHLTLLLAALNALCWARIGPCTDRWDGLLKCLNACCMHDIKVEHCYSNTVSLVHRLAVPSLTERVDKIVSAWIF